MTVSRRDMLLGLAGAGLWPVLPAMADISVTGGHAFGSSWRLAGETGLGHAGISRQVAAIVDEVNRAMSPYVPQSDLTRFNTGGTTGWQGMPDNLTEVAAAALAVARDTDGAFDPTIGPLVARYGFGPIDGAIGRFGDIDVGDGGLRKAHPELTLDLCGIAKGYALDRIVAALSQGGLRSGLIEVGGEVRTIGRHPSGRDWQVAIADPTTPDFKVRYVVCPSDLALATSGHAANGLSGPHTTSHLINPFDQRPASQALASVTVLAPTAMRADALATALCAAGPNAGIALARRLNVSALFVTDGATGVADVLTGDFASHVLS